MYNKEKRQEVYTLLREGKSPEEIAEITGVSKSTVIRWKKGINTMPENNTKTAEERDELARLCNRINFFITASLYVEAQKVIDEAKEKYPGNIQPFRKEIKLLIAKKNFYVAENLARQKLEETNDTHISTQLVKILMLQGKFKEARGLAAESLNNLDLDNTAKEIFELFLSQISYFEEKRKAANIRIAEENYNNNPKDKKSIFTYMEKLKINGELDYAYEVGIKALRLYPNNAFLNTLTNNISVLSERKPLAPQKNKHKNVPYKGGILSHMREQLYQGTHNNKIILFLRQYIEKHPGCLETRFLLMEAYCINPRDSKVALGLYKATKNSVEMSKEEASAFKGLRDIAREKDKIKMCVKQKVAPLYGKLIN